MLLLVIVTFTLTLFSVLSMDELSMIVLERKFDKHGFHRDLVTSVSLQLDVLPVYQDEADVSCQVLFIETIPSGAYVDRYQLAALRPFGGPDFLLTEEVDLEKPEFESSSFLLSIFTNASKQDNRVTFSYTLPIHLRYHAISSQQYATVMFDTPEIAIYCQDKQHGLPSQGFTGESVKQIKAPCGSTSPWLCDWTVIKVKDQEALYASVPVGQLEHYFLVTMGTVMTTILACCYLGYKVIYTDMKLKIS